MGISDSIATFIYQLLDEGSGSLELQRQELADRFNVVPSQINYVLSSRFKPEQGYIIESRRGGGGYIRIYRAQVDNTCRIMHIVNAVGGSIDEIDISHYLNNMLDYGIISEEQYRLICAAISDKALAPLKKEAKNIIRAGIFKNMLVAIIS